MKKSLLTLITLLGAAQINASAAYKFGTNNPNTTATMTIPTAGGGAAASASAGNGTNTGQSQQPFVGQGFTLGSNNQTTTTATQVSPDTTTDTTTATPVTKKKDQSDLNFALQSVIQKALKSHAVLNNDDSAAKKAAERKYADIKTANDAITSWDKLTKKHLQEIGKEVLKSAINNLDKTDQTKILQETSTQDLENIAELVFPSAFERYIWDPICNNPWKSAFATAATIKIGLAAYDNVKTTGGSIDYHKAAGTGLLLATAGFAMYNFNGIKNGIKQLNEGVKKFGQDTMNWFKSFSLKGAEDYAIPAIIGVGALLFDAKARGDKSIVQRVYKNGIMDTPFAVGSCVSDTTNAVTNTIVNSFINPAPPKPKELTPVELELQKATQEIEVLNNNLEAELAKLEYEANMLEAQGIAQERIDQIQEIAALKREKAAENIAMIKAKQEQRKHDKEHKKDRPWIHSALHYLVSSK